VILIISTRKVYQRVNTGEGTVTDKKFYATFYQQVREQSKS
jgi:hypothetical protein